MSPWGTLSAPLLSYRERRAPARIGSGSLSMPSQWSLRPLKARTNKKHPLHPFAVVVQSLRCVQLFTTPGTAAHQASLSFISRNLLRLMSIESVMPSNLLILCHLLLLLPFIFPRTPLPTQLIIASLLAQMVKNQPAIWETWVGKMPCRKAWKPTPVFLPGESPWTKEAGGLQSMGSQSGTRLSH